VRLETPPLNPESPESICTVGMIIADGHAGITTLKAEVYPEPPLIRVTFFTSPLATVHSAEAPEPEALGNDMLPDQLEHPVPPYTIVRFEIAPLRKGGVYVEISALMVALGHP